MSLAAAVTEAAYSGAIGFDDDLGETIVPEWLSGAEEEREADYRRTILCGGAIEQEVDSDDLEELIKAAKAWRDQEERERTPADELAVIAIYDTFACANLIFTPEL